MAGFSVGLWVEGVESQDDAERLVAAMLKALGDPCEIADAENVGGTDSVTVDLVRE